jgi:hypothetical protein
MKRVLYFPILGAYDISQADSIDPDNDALTVRGRLNGDGATVSLMP